MASEKKEVKFRVSSYNLFKNPKKKSSKSLMPRAKKSPLPRADAKTREQKEQERKVTKTYGRELIRMCQKRRIFKDDLVIVLAEAIDDDLYLARVDSYSQGSRQCKITRPYPYKMSRWVSIKRVETVGRWLGRQTGNGYPKAVALIDNLLKAFTEKMPTVSITKVLNFHDWDRSTPLHAAAKAGAYEVVRYLLRKKADPLKRDMWRQSVLHDATTVRGNFDVVRELIEGAKWSDRKLETLKRMIKDQDATGKTGLMNACMAVNTENFIPSCRLQCQVTLSIQIFLWFHPHRPRPLKTLYDIDTYATTPQQILRMLKMDFMEDVYPHKKEAKRKMAMGVLLQVADPGPGRPWQLNHVLRLRPNCDLKSSGVHRNSRLVIAPNAEIDAREKQLSMPVRSHESKMQIARQLQQQADNTAMQRATNQSLGILKGGLGSNKHQRISSIDTIDMNQLQMADIPFMDELREGDISESSAMVKLLLTAAESVQIGVEQKDVAGFSAFDHAQSGNYLSLLLQAEYEHKMSHQEGSPKQLTTRDRKMSHYPSVHPQKNFGRKDMTTKIDRPLPRKVIKSANIKNYEKKGSGSSLSAAAGSRNAASTNVSEITVGTRTPPKIGRGDTNGSVGAGPPGSDVKPLLKGGGTAKIKKSEQKDVVIKMHS
eukprot:CAMPEP_0167770508 /NCGR_PEP_ID=MMETSP0110_2-20121227/17971_1 /TAXON_ID=629695 /ORGANISM="Gymnochlora sp., Strain CCMP2014" /LENGTH=654 /DNA_ID=CAMNT_0007659719 /DNA_START=41 /DNA_END=2005 /DNA_ORIENTATION=-